ncbi:MAG: hypothetical protein ABII71_04235 [Candidatus Micrarchaeota archaeon]
MRWLLNIILAVMVFTALAVLAVVFILIPRLAELEFPEVPGVGLPGLSDMPMDDGEHQPPRPALPPDMQRYYELKNTSCDTLAGNFLIVASDVSYAEISGLIPIIPQEEAVVQGIAQGYSFNQTIKTYVRGDWMKRVVQVDGLEHTTIWKTGRIYECDDAGCTMDLLSDEQSDKYYADILAMRANCLHLGKTSLPDSADITKLLQIERTGLEEIGISRCDNFLISANRSYAMSLIEGEELDEGQYALLWALANMAAPMQECLDESTGITAYRNITLDLTHTYIFDFEPEGYFIANQQTELLYFTDDVPESFLGLPEQD